MNASAAMSATLVADQPIMPALRELVPNRPLTWGEARSLAERQAALLLDYFHIAEPPVPQLVISSLPGITVEWRDWDIHGVSGRLAAGRWHIVLPVGQPRQRQRFSLAHEFKHVLDEPTFQRNHAHLEPHGQAAHDERLADFFAASLLMPRPWIKHDWYGGLQNIRSLARRYYVSEAAMARRLLELGLRSRTPRPAHRRQHGGR